MNIFYAVLTLGALGGVFGLVLAVASKVFEVKTDPRLDLILDCLPGAAAAIPAAPAARRPFWRRRPR